MILYSFVKSYPVEQISSYGIQVAKLAGVPDPVIERAKVICGGAGAMRI